MNQKRHDEILRRAENRRLRSLARLARRQRILGGVPKGVFNPSMPPTTANVPRQPRPVKRSGCGRCGKRAESFRKTIEASKKNSF